VAADRQLSRGDTLTRRTRNPPLVLTLDVGTSSVRAALWDRDGNPTGAEAERTQRMTTAPDGTAILPVEELTANVEAVMDDLLADVKEAASDIAAVGMATLVGNVLAVDGARRNLTPLITYADTRPAEQVKRLRRELDEEGFHQRTGTLFHSAYLPARLLWAREEHPDLWRAARRWRDIGSHLYARWFDAEDVPVSYSVASWSGLLHRTRVAWDDELLDHVGLSLSKLPTLADFDRPCRGLAPEYARRWTALKDVPFFLAVGDGAAANIGSGCVAPDRVALTIGTSAAVRITVPGAPEVVPAGLWNYRVDGEHSLIGGALSDGGGLFAWMLATLRAGDPADPDQADAALMGCEPAGHGLTVLPFLSGERSPGYADAATLTITGMRRSTRPIDILQAGIEAVTYRLGLIGGLLTPLLADGAVIVASGGAIRSSPYWHQLAADVFGTAVFRTDTVEGTSRGVALLALKALGVIRDLEDVAVPLQDRVTPREEVVERHRKAIDRQQQLYARLIGAPIGSEAPGLPSTGTRIT
jgi:gluconokinase